MDNEYMVCAKWHFFLKKIFLKDRYFIVNQKIVTIFFFLPPKYLC